MNSLNTLSVRNLARRKGRYSLVAFGTCLGVAVVFAVLSSSAATSHALNRELQGSAAGTDVVVYPLGTYDAVLPAGVEEVLAHTPGVRRISPSFSLRSSVAAVRTDSRPVDSQILSITGLDWSQGGHVEELSFAAGGPPADVAPGGAGAPGGSGSPGAVTGAQVVLPTSEAKSLGVGLGSSLWLSTPTGPVRASVAGVLHNTGSALSDGGMVAYTTLGAAQRLGGRPGRLTSVSVVLAAGTSRADWIARSRAALGDGVALTDSSTLGAGFKGFLNTINGALILVAVIALFVGGFLIFLTFSVAVAERSRVYGTLRALGAYSRQVRRLVVREAAIIALIAGVAGVVLGYGLAAITVRLTGHLLRLPVGALGFSWSLAFIAVLLAVVISVGAAWLPARRASAVSPIAAMREGVSEPDRPPRPWRGLASIAAGVGLAITPVPPIVRSVSLLLVLLGAVLIVPWLLAPTARLLGRLTRRLSPGVGTISVAHLVKERSRSAYTLALIMVVLAMILSVAASSQAMEHTLNAVVDRQVGGGRDVQIFAPGAFDDGVGNQLATVRGIAGVTPIRFGNAEVLDRGVHQLSLELVDPSSYFDEASFSWVDGADHDARAALAAGGAILLPDVLAQNLGIRRGQHLEIRTTSGVRSFVLAGTFATIGTGSGIVGSTVDLNLFGNGRPNGYIARLTSAANPEAVRQDIVRQLGRYGASATTAASFKAGALRQLRGFFSIFYALLAVAALIGMLGLANTLIVSVLARTREIGMLRSTGSRRRQIRGMVLVEAETLAATAYLLALPLGLLLAAAIIRGQRATFGFSVRFTYPWALVIPLGIAAAALAALAAAVPARRAGRLMPVEALRME